MTRKKLLLIPLALLLAITLVAIGCPAPPEEPTPPAPPAPPVPPAPPAPEVTTLRLCTGFAVTHFYCTDVIPTFKEVVEQRSDGRIKVDTYLAGELYRHGDVPSVIPAGAIEIALVPQGHMGVLSPIFGITEYSFAVFNYEAWKAAQGVVLPIYEAILQEHNTKLLTPLYFGIDSLATRKPVRLTEDVKGLKLRGPTGSYLNCFVAWGATPAALPISEVDDALRKGAIDGVMTSLSSVWSRNWYESTSYVTVTSYNGALLVMNLDAFNRLSAGDQKIILEAAQKAREVSEEKGQAYEEEAVAGLEAAGATVYILTPEEGKLWREATKPAYHTWVESSAKVGHEEEAIKILRALGIELD